MESKYIINVSLNGKHFFRVEKTNDIETTKVLSELKKRFPDYEITVTYWECIGRQL